MLWEPWQSEQVAACIYASCLPLSMDTVAETGGLLIVAFAAGLSNIDPVDCRSSVAERKNSLHLPVSRVTVDARSTGLAIQDRLPMNVLIVDLVGLHVKECATHIGNRFTRPMTSFTIQRQWKINGRRLTGRCCTGVLIREY